MRNFLITAAIPTYKRPRQFRRALESILAQSRPPDQIVVGDDGSDVDVRDICLSFKDSRIHYVVRRPERRMTDNWNFVTHWAGDGLVALLEDDNIWEVDHLAHAEQLWARFPNLESITLDIARLGTIMDTSSSIGCIFQSGMRGWQAMEVG